MLLVILTSSKQDKAAIGALLTSVLVHEAGVWRKGRTTQNVNFEGNYLNPLHGSPELHFVCITFLSTVLFI